MSAGEAAGGPRTSLDRRDALWAAAPGLAALVVRAAFVARLGVPPYDPWRHLALVRNLRDGLGFTLFDGQPYLWYAPPWYRLCALLPAGVAPDLLAALLSALCPPLLYLLMRRAGASRPAAVVGGFLLALSGPGVAFTCHYGPEALALLLALGGPLVAACGRGAPTSWAGGVAYGLALVLRMNFAFGVFFFLPWTRSGRRAAGLAAGLALPLALAWWRNHRIIASYPFVFTWDGLATRSADFDVLSTLLIQMHPAVHEALRRLHEIVVPRPEWLWGPRGPAWLLILFVLCGLGAVLASRRAHLLLAAFLPLLYFLFLDRTLSSHFFRLYLPLFPAFFWALGLVAADLARRAGRRRGPILAGLLVAVALGSGARMLVPVDGPHLAAVTPPRGLLAGEAYLVNSGRYQPESLIWRWPERRFLGMPLYAEQWPEFRAAFPGYRFVLWHDFSVQPEIRRLVRDLVGDRPSRAAINPYGHVYEVLGPLPPADE